MENVVNHTKTFVQESLPIEAERHDFLEAFLHLFLKEWEVLSEL